MTQKPTVQYKLATELSDNAIDVLFDVCRVKQSCWSKEKINTSQNKKIYIQCRKFNWDTPYFGNKILIF